MCLEPLSLFQILCVDSINISFVTQILPVKQLCNILIFWVCFATLKAYEELNRHLANNECHWSPNTSIHVVFSSNAVTDAYQEEFLSLLVDCKIWEDDSLLKMNELQVWSAVCAVNVVPKVLRENLSMYLSASVAFHSRDFLTLQSKVFLAS